ncbi:MAG: hypothetical protein HKN52_05640 [Eudoraea sp.]|nr:hypothetical protein [Eudoraea sp.]
MNKAPSIILLFLVMLSCKSDDSFSTDSIVGTWRLIEMLADPGDGSGEFMPVTSSKTIEFLADGSFTSNGDICAFSTANDGTSEGSYLTTDTGYSIECEGAFVSTLNLQLKDGVLILTFFCIEPCQQKYKKIK